MFMGNCPDCGTSLYWNEDLERLIRKDPAPGCFCRLPEIEDEDGEEETTEYLYRKNETLSLWNCLKGEAIGGGASLIVHAHPLHSLLIVAAMAQINKYDSCRLTFFNREEIDDDESISSTGK